MNHIRFHMNKTRGTANVSGTRMLFYFLNDSNRENLVECTLKLTS